MGVNQRPTTVVVLELNPTLWLSRQQQQQEELPNKSCHRHTRAYLCTSRTKPASPEKQGSGCSRFPMSKPSTALARSPWGRALASGQSPWLCLVLLLWYWLCDGVLWLQAALESTASVWNNRTAERGSRVQHEARLTTHVSTVKRRSEERLAVVMWDRLPLVVAWGGDNCVLRGKISIWKLQNCVRTVSNKTRGIRPYFEF